MRAQGALSGCHTGLGTPPAMATIFAQYSALAMTDLAVFLWSSWVHDIVDRTNRSPGKLTYQVAQAPLCHARLFACPSAIKVASPCRRWNVIRSTLSSTFSFASHPGDLPQVTWLAPGTSGPSAERKGAGRHKAAVPEGAEGACPMRLG